MLLVGDLYDHLMSTRIFIMMMSKNIHMSTKNYAESGYGLKLDMLTSCTNYVSYPRRSGLVRKSDHLIPISFILFYAIRRGKGVLLGIIRQNPSVSKSNWSHVIFQFSFINLGYIL